MQVGRPNKRSGPGNMVDGARGWNKQVVGLNWLGLYVASDPHGDGPPAPAAGELDECAVYVVMLRGFERERKLDWFRPAGGERRSLGGDGA